MRRVIRFGLITAALVACFGFFDVAASNAQGEITKIINRMDAHNKALSSMRADVTMVKFNAQLNVSDASYGTTSYLPKTPKRAMYVRIDWTKPVEEQISVIGDEYELYRPRLGQVIQGKTSKAQNRAGVGNTLGFMSMSKDQLRANYDVTYIGDEQISGGTPTLHLQLNPKAATTYKMAELWVDTDGMPRQAKVTENNNDTTTVLLTNIKKNETLKGDIFKLKYPGTVKKIKA